MEMPADQIALSDAMREFYARSIRVLDQIMIGHGASLAQTRLLSFVASHAPVRSVDIAQNFGFAPRTVTEAIDALEREGMIRRERHVTDRRAKTIVLTELGESTIAKAVPMRQELISKLYNGLSTDECTLLTSLVLRLNSRIDELRHDLLD